MSLAELQELILYVIGTAVLVGFLFTLLLAIFEHKE